MYSEKNYSKKIISLPESFGELKTLRKLNINFNEIKLLPDSFGKLENL